MNAEQVMIALICATVVIRELDHHRDKATTYRNITKLAGYLEETSALMILLNAKINALEKPKQSHEISIY